MTAILIDESKWLTASLFLAAIGRVLIAIAVLAHAGLFVSSLIFLANGQRIEPFRGIE